jgi:hypothetical protein
VVVTVTVTGPRRDSTAEPGAVPSTPPRTSGGSRVSCVSASFCMATDNLGQASQFNGSRWAAPLVIGLGQRGEELGPVSVSCASLAFCIAFDPFGYAGGFDGTSWRDLGVVHDGFRPALTAQSVSCARASFCVVVHKS